MIKPINRRGFLTGLGLVIAAPAIVRASALMVAPRRPWPLVLWRNGRLVCNGAFINARDYPDLFSAMGHSFGGDGQTFRLPDLGSVAPYVINSELSLNGPAGTLVLAV